jgi:L-rhamnose isomerase
MNTARIEKAYEIAREIYAEHGVDADEAQKKLKTVPLSIHCWQGDDVGGFETAGSNGPGGGLAVTGRFPGKARTVDELRDDLRRALALIPGSHRLNLHAIYGEFGARPPDRNALEPDHFRGWVEWAREEKVKLDFNATCFGHPLAASGFTLSHRDKAIRRFWVEHVKCCRKVSSFMGRELKSPCLHNLWIPDGAKEAPVDRALYRGLLKESLDEIFAVEFSPSQVRDSLEGKLFGIGSEAFVVGSHEFYLGYAVAKQKFLCLDLGHFHPTESVADKISALLPFLPGLVFHLSRGLRWDSDHVVILDEDLKAVTEEFVRTHAFEKCHLALDYFDASLNRVGAWVIGARAVLKGLLRAFLLPAKKLAAAERRGDGFAGLALREEARTLPLGAVWDDYCLKSGVPPGAEYIADVARYESEVLVRRV